MNEKSVQWIDKKNVKFMLQLKNFKTPKDVNKLEKPVAVPFVGNNPFRLPTF